MIGQINNNIDCITCTLVQSTSQARSRQSMLPGRNGACAGSSSLTQASQQESQPTPAGRHRLPVAARSRLERWVQHDAPKLKSCPGPQIHLQAVPGASSAARAQSASIWEQHTLVRQPLVVAPGHPCACGPRQDQTNPINKSTGWCKIVKVVLQSCPGPTNPSVSGARPQQRRARSKCGAIP